MQVFKMSEVRKLDINGVVLFIKLDYQKSEVSFIKPDGTDNYFLFSGRSRDYLGGWVKIFRALEEATVWADNLLDKEKERVSEMKFNNTLDIYTSIKNLDEEQPNDKDD